MSPIRARKSIGGKWFRVNFTLRSVVDFMRDWLPDGHVDPGRRPWSSITIGPRGFSYNTARRTARANLPGPFSYETPRLVERSQVVDVDALEQPRSRENLPVRWVDADGRRWEQTQRPDGGTSTRYLPDPVSDDEAEQQPCPRCLAEPGSPCRTRGTGRPTKPHLPRIELARLARAYPEPDRQFSCEHGIAADTRCDLCDEQPAEIPPWGTPPR